MEFEVNFSSSSPDCQAWMSRGILCFYGFQTEESIQCFEKALSHDSQCAMAHYFIAYCCASNYNDPGGFDRSRSFKESKRALELSENSQHVSAWERALIAALPSRFCYPVNSKSTSELQVNFAKAMKPVYEEFGDNNAEVASVYAESLMMLRPWALWTPPPSIKPAAPETLELVEVLERGLKQNPTHPGLCHFYIHTMELSDSPHKALACANILRTRYPSQGHLLHMPSHIDMWVGQYKEAVEANEKGVASDEKYVSRTGQDNEFYKMYRMHNYHFVVWACMFDGQFSKAMEYAERAEKQLGEEAVTYMFKGQPLGSMFLEGFSSILWHVLVRFGRWEDIISRPVKNSVLYPSATAISHYARGIAFAVMGKLDDADRERQKFYTSLQAKALQQCYLIKNLMYNPANNNGILNVAEAVLNGEIEYHKGNYEEAFKYLRLAVERDDKLNYDEPWGWMTPARHVLGALLLEQGHAQEAEAIYREDLNRYKNNMWSLLGLCQALKQQHKNEEEIVEVQALLKTASERSDIEIGASCLCATKMRCQA